MVHCQISYHDEVIECVTLYRLFFIWSCGQLNNYITATSNQSDMIPDHDCFSF